MQKRPTKFAIVNGRARPVPVPSKRWVDRSRKASIASGVHSLGMI